MCHSECKAINVQAWGSPCILIVLFIFSVYCSKIFRKKLFLTEGINIIKVINYLHAFVDLITTKLPKKSSGLNRVSNSITVFKSGCFQEHCQSTCGTNPAS